MSQRKLRRSTVHQFEHKSKPYPDKSPVNINSVGGLFLNEIILPDVPEGDLDDIHPAARTGRWRYIRYADGSEVLCDPDSDPMEWKNLASNPEYTLLRRKLKAHFPDIGDSHVDAPSDPNK